MSEALLHSLSNVLVLILIAAFGWEAGRRGKIDAQGRTITAKIVNLSIPCFLFYSVTSKFSHDQLVELLKMACRPFLAVGLNLLISLLIVKAGLIRKEIQGVFTACFTG